MTWLLAYDRGASEAMGRPPLLAFCQHALLLAQLLLAMPTLREAFGQADLLNSAEERCLQQAVESLDILLLGTQLDSGSVWGLLQNLSACAHVAAHIQVCKAEGPMIAAGVGAALCMPCHAMPEAPCAALCPEQDTVITVADHEDNSAKRLLVPVIVPILAVLLAVGAALLLWAVRQRVLRRRKTLWGKIKAPTASPLTTLVITDIQDSTTLYECLPGASERWMAQRLCIPSLLLFGFPFDADTHSVLPAA